MMTRKILTTLAFLLVVHLLSAQYSFRADKTRLQMPDTLIKAPENWFNLDYQLDKVRGISAEKAYKELLSGKQSKTIIVAIIDSGIDIEHEDLSDKIWTNPKEIIGNGKDDDKNGYVDDIHGWNFIGNAKGEMINYDNLELTREYARLKKVYDGKSATDFTGKALDEYNYYSELKTEYDKKYKEAEPYYTFLGNALKSYKSADETIKKELKKDTYTDEEAQAIQSDNPEVQKAKQVLASLKAMGLTPDQLVEGYDYFRERIEYNLNLEYDPRALVGDNYKKLKEKKYGNNIVEGPDAFHGTHVAGIIGANRDNTVGIKGIASDIKIMVLRTVPNGDERDKDVANSIYYAADNGAKVINMSFGKDFSPNKEIVDKAVQYAEKKGVLMIHAAGNDNRDNDLRKNFPYPTYLKSKLNCTTWIEVGASSWKDNNEFVGSFSNFGQNSVDVFAPGVEVYSSTPDNKYRNADGTSMAAPMVTGLAALVWSYYPELNAEDVKKIILESSVKYTTEKVDLPGKPGETIEFGKLSRTGGLVNAYNALKMAETYKK
jgi:subtilisin family serine protease